MRPEAARPGTAPATPHAAFSGLNALARDGEDIRAAAAAHLEYLTTLAKDLGVIDVVESYFTPIVGRWSDLHAEAGRWRHAAETAGRVSGELGTTSVASTLPGRARTLTRSSRTSVRSASRAGTSRTR